MTKSEIKDLFKDNKPSRNHISAVALSNITCFAIVNLQMDNETLDYYYEVGIEELANSEMPYEQYEIMKEQGWSINGEKLIIFL
jgi:hypothetical protein